MSYSLGDIQWSADRVFDNICTSRKTKVSKYSALNTRVFVLRSTYEPPDDKTNKMTVRPAKTQISLVIHPVWSESLLCAQWVVKEPNFLYAHSDDSDQSWRIPRLIWDFAGRTGHFVCFVMRRFIYNLISKRSIAVYPLNCKLQLTSSVRLLRSEKKGSYWQVHEFGWHTKVKKIMCVFQVFPTLPRFLPRP